MASNLTEQVRGIVKVVTAVANGNLTQRLTVQAKGEVAALADTINNMTDTLATFADQVTNVAREVGVDGRLGGQANVPGAAGTWKDLTGNVNLLAANLTTQVRAIAEVATAVTKGDLTRSIQVEARGEVAELKDNLNTMISNLRETTESNREQDWLKTNLAKFTGMLQGQRELNTVGQMLAYRAGARWSRPIRAPSTISTAADDNTKLKLLSSYAHGGGRLTETIRLGEGLVGQCAVEKKRILLTDVPPDFITISSSLGEATRVEHRRAAGALRGADEGRHRTGRSIRFTDVNLTFLDQLTQTIGVVLQHHRGDDAHRRAAHAVAATHGRIAIPPERTAENQRGAGHESKAACRAERRGRAQERRGRAGASRAGGKSCRAGAHLEIQVRVSRQHVP